MVINMALKDLEICKINDGQEVNREFTKDWDIIDHCGQYNGKTTISFVGFILYRGKILFSFPKHYTFSSNAEENKNDMKKIIQILALTKATSGSFDKGEKDEFPLRAYMDVAMYYKQYGLYTVDRRYVDRGYNGNINWKKTMKESDKIITTNGIVFNPFVLNKKKNTNVFLSECMDFVLSDASQNYKECMDFIVQYKTKIKHKKKLDFHYACRKLYKIKNDYFKDTEKRLINGLIQYFSWKSKSNENIRMLTNTFENYWEYMIEIYLNHNFLGYENDKIIWRKNCNSKVFYKPNMEYVEDPTVVKEPGAHYKTQYDHYVAPNDNEIYIFDSKYFNREVEELNYKQMVYHYILKQKYPDAQIVNGLILPTEKKYYTRKHVDRENLDGVKIIEHYVNFSDVLNFVLKNKDEYRTKIRN